MTATYTHWTLPRRRPGARYVFDWTAKAHELLAWALSTTLAARHLGDVRIVTDEAGAQELAWIGLPATLDVALDDDALGALLPYWTVGKMATYQAAALVPGTFVHLDADVFLTRGLPAAFLAAPLGVQSVESLDVSHYAGYYLATMQTMERALALPEAWAADRARPLSQRPAYNMGLVVANGAGKAVLADAARAALHLLADAKHRLRGPAVSDTCVTAEQYLFAATARRAGVPVTPLIPPADTARGQAAAEALGYAHLFGNAKRSPAALSRLVARARAECPALAARILTRHPL